MTQETLDLLLPQVIHSPEYYENKYPSRNISDKSIVTRFGPSPTGFMHIGGVYIAIIGKNLAITSEGVFFIRIEDTDQNRKVDGSDKHFRETFQYFGIEALEDSVTGKYGPYTQSDRVEIYKTFVKKLLEEGNAYPCFCTKDELNNDYLKQKELKIDTGYYGRWAKCRHLPESKIRENIEKDKSYVIRFKSNGRDDQVSFIDAIRGKISARDNYNDVVILKSSSDTIQLPTYHLAHAVDDHLMRVNLVLRSEEWIPSVPLHMQLFSALGFEQIKYAHIAPLMKIDGESKRKLSKRKDPEASVTYYMESGVPSESIRIYLKGLANSNLLDESPLVVMNAQLKLSKMSKSGALIDMVKLDNVSANFISTLSAGQILQHLLVWSSQFDQIVHDTINENLDYTLKVIDLDRFNNSKIRKDLTKWSDFIPLYGFLYPSLFTSVKYADVLPDAISKEAVNSFCNTFVNQYSFSEGDNTEWFEEIKRISASANFAINKKQFNSAPESFHGMIRESTQILRLAITKRLSSPSLYEIMKLLGKTEVINRVKLFQTK